MRIQVLVSRGPAREVKLITDDRLDDPNSYRFEGQGRAGSGNAYVELDRIEGRALAISLIEWLAALPAEVEESTPPPRRREPDEPYVFYHPDRPDEDDIIVPANDGYKVTSYNLRGYRQRI